MQLWRPRAFQGGGDGSAVGWEQKWRRESARSRSTITLPCACTKQAVAEHGHFVQQKRRGVAGKRSVAAEHRSFGRMEAVACGGHQLSIPSRGAC
ncbi:unnamed protein product [Urochloa humidicola]